MKNDTEQEINMKTKIMLLKEIFVNEDFYGSQWEEFDEKKDRVTGKWRLEDNDVAIEIAHGYWYGFFKKRWIEETEWYSSDEVRFIQEFDCKT